MDIIGTLATGLSVWAATETTYLAPLVEKRKKEEEKNKKKRKKKMCFVAQLVTMVRCY